MTGDVWCAIYMVIGTVVLALVITVIENKKWRIK